jgi:signal transduction histidine kinase
METALLTTIALGGFSVFLYWEIAKLKEKNLKDYQQASKKIKDLSFLKDFQYKIAYIQDIEKIAEEIITHIEKIYKYSSISYLTVKDSHLDFKIYSKDHISKFYVKNVREGMLSSLSEFLDQYPEDVKENIQAEKLSDDGSHNFLSSFHVPVTIKNKVSMLIHISSIHKNLYKEEEMTALLRLADTASMSLSNFEKILSKKVGHYEKTISSLHESISSAEKKRTQKETLREDMTHLMVHELRAPMTTIKDLSELLSDPKLKQSKKQQLLKLLQRQSKKVLIQIGSILDAAKLDAGKLVLHKTKQDIVKLIRQEVSGFMPQSEKKEVDLSYEPPSKSVPLIYFDLERITQVINNLLSNSIKFTNEKGKITVNIEYKAVPPVLDGISPMKPILSLDKHIIVSVKDTGIGIEKNQQKTLFSKYIQAKSTPQKSKTQGTGLGLYLVKGVIEAHHGIVWIKSAPGKGTKISFALPATKQLTTNN